MNPKLDKIRKDQPVCKYPRESYNRIVEILEKLKGGRGIDFQQRGDEWTISVNLAWLMQFLEANVSPMIDSSENETAMAVASGGGGGSGYTGTKTVVTNVAWDETNHKFTKTVETQTYVNGLLQPGATSATSDIVTLVPEMP